ncbi:MAG: HAD family hydrolase [DPANN group archaeon]|nr:HAD family hydrolase [DPANN group archaeon]
MTIKAIFFDFWGTIVENGVFPSPVRQVKRILDLDMDFSEYIQKFEQIFMVQSYDDLYAAFEAVCKAFNIAPEKKMLDELVGLWNRNKLFAKPYIDTKLMLERLGKDLKLVLISNTDCFSVMQIMEKYDMAKYFDVILLSFQEGKLKADPALFEKGIETLGISKEEAIMIGDSLESDIESAKRAGIKALLIDRRGRRNYPDKISNLKEITNHL